MDIKFEESLLIDLETSSISCKRDERPAEEKQEQIIQQRSEFYKAENDKIESVLKKLHLMNDRGELLISKQAEEVLDKMVDLQDKLNIKSFDAVSLGLAQADILQKQNNYVAKLQMCIKHYTNLNERLDEETKTLELTVDEARNTINSLGMSDTELTNLKMKAAQLESDLLKFEKQHPWLKDSKYDLVSISEKLNVLNSLRDKKAELEKELSVYKGLKPNLREANQQLAEAKAEYEEISKKLVDNLA